MVITPTRAENKQSGNLKIYPSPAENSISLQNFKVGDQIILRNIVGKEIKIINTVNEYLQIDISNLAQGIYFLEEPGRGTVKFIKM